MFPSLQKVISHSLPPPHTQHCPKHHCVTGSIQVINVSLDINLDGITILPGFCFLEGSILLFQIASIAILNSTNGTASLNYFLSSEGSLCVHSSGFVNHFYLWFNDLSKLLSPSLYLLLSRLFLCSL